MMASLLAFILLTAVVCAAAWTDVREQKVYNRLTYPAMLTGLLLWTLAGFFQEGHLHGAVDGLTRASLGLACGLIPFWVIFIMGGLNGGDVKLMGAVGALGAAAGTEASSGVTWEFVLDTAVIAMAVNLVIAIVVMVRCRLVKRTLSRLFTAALSTAAKTRADIPEDSPRIPFTVGIAVGSLLAGMKYLLGLNLPLMDWGA